MVDSLALAQIIDIIHGTVPCIISMRKCICTWTTRTINKRFV